ncbi:hypothetical protein TWF192_002797 [Orbilia oligospora]|uniref:Uncharacterized protein n=1 Tax=Orbilia oligospora TaxID=2813651 RepID=A0A6G1LSS9_ORBOL|nr:hypothetical protein TWF191_001980 [Orbilia oligospora]KAF3232870.1 hypothetical protein TWF192_002797 [Orbilia oligospora]
MVQHEDDTAITFSERSLSLRQMAATISDDKSGLPPDDWNMPPCVHLDPVEWKYYVREGRLQRSETNIFWSERKQDFPHLLFERTSDRESGTWICGYYIMKAELGFEIGAVARSDPLWGCVVGLITGFHGLRKRLARDYRRCQVDINNITYEGTGNILYDVILSPTDGLFIIYKSDRPHDPTPTQQQYTPEGRLIRSEASRTATWGDMMYSIWFTQVFAHDQPTEGNGPSSRSRLQLHPRPDVGSRIPSSHEPHSGNLTSKGPLAPRLDGLSVIIFRGMDNAKGLRIVDEGYNKLKLCRELDTLRVTHIDKRIKSLVFDILLMVPGVCGMHEMLSRHYNALDSKFIEEIIVKYSRDGGVEGRLLPTIMLKLGETKLPVESLGHTLM